MACIGSMRGWKEFSGEAGKTLSPVLASSLVGGLLGEDIGGRMISENQATGRVLALHQMVICSVRKWAALSLTLWYVFESSAGGRERSRRGRHP